MNFFARQKIFIHLVFPHPRFFAFLRRAREVSLDEATLRRNVPAQGDLFYRFVIRRCREEIRRTGGRGRCGFVDFLRRLGLVFESLLVEERIVAVSDRAQIESGANIRRLGRCGQRCKDDQDQTNDGSLGISHVPINPAAASAQ